MSERLKRDCYNCHHSAARHGERQVRKNTLVCLMHAVGVAPDQLHDYHIAPCGVRLVDGGLAPYRWEAMDI